MDIEVEKGKETMEWINRESWEPREPYHHREPWSFWGQTHSWRQEFVAITLWRDIVHP